MMLCTAQASSSAGEFHSTFGDRFLLAGEPEGIDLELIFWGLYLELHCVLPHQLAYLRLHITEPRLAVACRGCDR